ncbi:MAG TPA: ABC transporter substrate-binding protein [Planosporangium sp.]|jgi:hypothetical protein|nr:ABC transporter substrate-binding protein [Planosporangium sp.]
MTGAVVSRRAVLGAAVGAAATGMTGCVSPRRPIQVAVVWSADELARFRDVLSGYHDHPVDVVSVRNDMDGFLRARYGTGNQPDVAIFPQIGLIADYARRRWLAKLEFLNNRYPDAWNAPLRVDGPLYGAWVKATHKSLFWYAPGALPDGREPASWAEFADLVKRLAGAGPGSGRRAPLAIGAADGWVLTDWFENVLASVTTDLEYRSITNGESPWDGDKVRIALGRLADVWGIPNAFPHGGRRALLTQNEESVTQVFARNEAAMVFEGDFVAAVAAGFGASPPLPKFRFPPVEGDQRLLVAGDAAVVFKGSQTGTGLVNWLTGPEQPFSRWMKAGGYLPPQRRDQQQDGGDPLIGEFSGQLREATTRGLLRFDLSDQLRGSLGGPDGLGIWKILQDFFADVAVRRLAAEDAVDRACRGLEAARRAAAA